MKCYIIFYPALIVVTYYVRLSEWVYADSFVYYNSLYIIKTADVRLIINCAV